MLDLAVKAFYYRGHTLQGFIVVAAVCGGMALFAAWVAWKNFGPPGRRTRSEPHKPEEESSRRQP